METKKIIFKGLSPRDSITYEDKIFKNGAIVEMPINIADAYIKTKLAYEISDMNEAKNFQKLETTSMQKRKAIEEKAKAKKGENE
ncbi:hypothetical protein [Anaerophilus nitritogenes]|uniref:hypothetical protein n=1 Tax=Anaerophilus nitritogenes TaxID=2498136 RepID=UPI00101CDCC9|nr:hypothetical protein [Anaerophilus nitritogenes]